MTSWSPVFQRRVPPRSSPATFAAAPGSHRAARPERQGSQAPQAGTKAMITWSPTSKPSVFAPVSTTSPAASWPRTIGITRGREPSITDRSEWHRPAAPTLTSSSPSPGPSSSSSAISRAATRRRARAGPSRAGRHRGPSWRHLLGGGQLQAFQGGAYRVRYRRRAAVLPVDEDVHEVTLGGGLVGLFAEDAELV